MEILSHSKIFFLRQVRTSVRLPAALFLSTFQPFVWMVLFGNLFQSVSTIRGFQAGSYLQFLAPGITIMGALFGSTYSGLGILGDMHSGLLDKLLAAPVSRGAILVGPLLQTTIQTVIQAGIILLTAFGMGARSSGGTLGVLTLLVVAALLGSTFAAISNGIALITRRQRTLISIVNFISLPLTFLSSMMIPHSLMPRWMRNLATLNPIDWAVTAGRAAFEGYPWQEVLAPLGILVLFVVLAWIFSIYSFALYHRAN
jgi:ABC-2 type transport system permease protein